MPDINNAQGGLLAGGGGAVPAAAPESAAPASSGVDPQMQEAYDKVVMAGMKILFENKKTSKGIVSRLKADKDKPAKALSDTAAILMIQLDQQAGGKIPEEVILPAAIELLEQTSELADSLGLFPIDDAVLNRAGQLMVANLAEQYGTTPEDIQEMMGSVNEQELQMIEQEQGNFTRKQPPQEQV
jgi:hypothetical protein